MADFNKEQQYEPITFYSEKNLLPEFTDYSMKDRTYRYMKEKPLYPFGFGLSYTSFDINTDSVVLAPSYVSTSITVTNVGMVPGREVVQIYIEAPLGKLSKPSKVLAGFIR